jgi:hypothetical protein
MNMIRRRKISRVNRVKQEWLLILACVTFSGCATVNFSANYYTPPANYRVQVRDSWDELIRKTKVSGNYQMAIVPEGACKMGIPEIEGRLVKLPDSFIKYVYQNYYADRQKIFDCVIAHEISHVEYNLHNMSTPKAHYEVDKKAMELLNSFGICRPQDYYNTFIVLKSYWFARKGVAGHMANAGWNLISAASVVCGGPGYFANWFATDLDKRIALIRKYNKIPGNSRFKRSKEEGQ